MASVNSSDYRLWDTRVSFFVFESCSACTFSQTFRGYPEVSDEFICGSALQGGQTLGVISPTLDAAMVRSEYFYQGFATGAGLGAALNYWFNARVENHGEDPFAFDSGDLVGYTVFGDPWMHTSAPLLQAPTLHYIMLYYPTGWLRNTVESILSSIGISFPEPPKDVAFFTMSDPLQKMAAGYEMTVSERIAFGNFSFWWPIRWTVPEQNVLRSWGVFIDDMSVAPYGNRYSLRALLKDGNRGGTTPTCAVAHREGVNQYTRCSR